MYNLLKKKKPMSTKPGTVDRVFEVHEESEKNESGIKPVIIKYEPEVKKTRNELHK